MVELRVLGSPSLVGPDGHEARSVLQQPKRLALLTYLALTSYGSFQRRDRILGLFWPDSTGDKARASLATALVRLRDALGVGVILKRGKGEIGIDPDALSCDAAEFLQAVDVEDWPRAAEVYGGPLLDGFFLDGCPEFDTWLEHTRAHLKRTAVSAFGRLTEQAMAADDESARALAERGYEIDPLDGGAVRCLMQVLARSGQRDAALGVYETYAASVHEERAIEPSPETLILVRQIREGRVGREPTPDSDEEVDTSVVSPAGVDPGPSLPLSEVVRRLNAVLAGRYRIERELAEGGMATVYLADDLRHQRKLALKVLKPELVPVLGAERFLAEIKTTAGLQHPHILPIFESGEAAGFLYYVMPYVEGETLAARVNREGQLPIDDALRITREVADALGYAHRRGVVHRDIKPENILFSGGHALVADFGIAKAVTAAGSDSVTQRGVALGTPSYMSPEQAFGRELDGRSDIYSLACVLYEMLTGAPPFTAPNPGVVLARHAKDPPPPLRTARPAVPPSVSVVLEKGLAKTPADRWRSAAEFAAALESAKTARTRPRLTRWYRYLVPATLVLTAAAAGALAVVVRAPRSAPRAAPTFVQLTFTGDVSEATISPDGKLVAYVTSPRFGPMSDVEAQKILVKQVTGDHVHTVADSLFDVCALRFTPGGDRLTFWTRSGPRMEHRGYSVSWLGGTPMPITVDGSPPCYPVLSPDGSRAVWISSSPSGDLVMIRQLLAGSRQRDSIVLGADVESPSRLDGGVMLTHWSHGGRWLLAFTGSPSGKYALEIVSPDGAQMHTLVTGDHLLRSPRWGADDGAIYYAVGSLNAANLMKLRIDPRTGRAIGQPELVLAGIPLSDFDVTMDGSLLAMTRSTQRGRIQVGSIPEDATHEPVRLVQLSEGVVDDWDPAISPDGRMIAFTRGEVDNREVFVRPIGGGPAQRIASIKGRVRDVRWSPDGQQLAFVWDSAGTDTGWLTVASVSSRTWRRLHKGRIGPSGARPPLDWAPAGIVFLSFPSDTLAVLSLLDPEADRVEPVPLAFDDQCAGAPLTSPDGSRVLSTRWDCRVTLSLPLGALLDSLEFGGTPIGWATNGRVYYHEVADNNSEIWSIPSEGGTPTFHLRLDTRCLRVSVSRDARTFACHEFYTESDVWLVEGFDVALM